jgi:hypothetical protein
MPELPGDEASAREGRDHAPGTAKHLDDEPAGDHGRVTPHATDASAPFRRIAPPRSIDVAVR